MKLMPQEVEVWYLIPAIRRELAKCLIDNYDFSQKRVAGVLGITESAVSQYLKQKRGGELKFVKEELDKIQKVADKIVNDEESAGKFLFELSQELRGTESLCKLHCKHDRSIEGNCGICGSK
ncbi:transcriptional regulator [Candidatus Pacearchaeota archaeon]|nr:transcriptional regulator [Candidatus Pacearchaeota archaeon]